MLLFQVPLGADSLFHAVLRQMRVDERYTARHLRYQCLMTVMQLGYRFHQCYAAYFSVVGEPESFGPELRLPGPMTFRRYLRMMCSCLMPADSVMLDALAVTFGWKITVLQASTLREYR